MIEITLQSSLADYSTLYLLHLINLYHSIIIASFLYHSIIIVAKRECLISWIHSLSSDASIYRDARTTLK